MGQKWTCAYVFRWTPILTFMRRRLELLDWFDQHIDPVSFVDDHDHLGVALVSRDVRVTVDRRGMVITSASTDVPLTALEGAIEGVFGVLEPKGSTLEAFNSLWTRVLDQNYNEARAQFALRLAAAGTSVGGFRPIDASALMDVESTNWVGQVEWGVVEQSELAARIKRPKLGRIEFESGRRPPTDMALDDLPQVALLADVSFKRQIGGAVADAGEVLAAVSDADTVASRFVDALYPGFAREGDAHEFREAQ